MSSCYLSERGIPSKESIEKIKSVSLEYLHNHPEVWAAVKRWISCGDALNAHMRSCTERERTVLEKMLDKVLDVYTCKREIVLYRGTKDAMNESFHSGGYVSLTDSERTANGYGDFVYEVRIPKGTHIFYVSALAYFVGFRGRSND